MPCWLCQVCAKTNNVLQCNNPTQAFAVPQHWAPHTARCVAPLAGPSHLFSTHRHTIRTHQLPAILQTYFVDHSPWSCNKAPPSISSKPGTICITVTVNMLRACASRSLDSPVFTHGTTIGSLGYDARRGMHAYLQGAHTTPRWHM